MTEQALIISNDPKSNKSYGIIADYIMKNFREYNWHLINSERSYGKPKDMYYYWEWYTGQSVFERNSDIMPNIIKKVKPKFILTIDDLDNIGYLSKYKDNNLPWIQYFPIDNNDPATLRDSVNIIFSCDISVCMSKFGYESANDYGLKIDKYIYPFIDTENYHKITDERIEQFKKRYDLEGKKVLLFVGRPNWRKNIELLLGAFKKLIDKRNDVVLFLHMDFHDPCAEFNIWKLIYSMDIPSKLISSFEGFEWHTGIPKSMMSILYNIADVYVSTHAGEGFGLPAAEAMATEVPGVMTDCTTTPELYEYGKRGFGAKVKGDILERGVVRPFVDINDFVEKVEILLDDESLRKSMGKAGRKWVVENCSIPVIKKKWDEVFHMMDVQRVEVSGMYEPTD